MKRKPPHLSPADLRLIRTILLPIQRELSGMRKQLVKLAKKKDEVRQIELHQNP